MRLVALRNEMYEKSIACIAGSGPSDPTSIAAI
jgi:hypothetical protein